MRVCKTWKNSVSVKVYDSRIFADVTSALCIRTNINNPIRLTAIASAFGGRSFAV
jgi:hypothetical protein